MKKIFAVLATIFLFSGVATAGVNTLGLEGITAYSRSWLHVNDKDIDLSSPSGGLNYMIGFNEVKRDDGTIFKPATRGMQISTAFSSDRGLNLTRLGLAYWNAFVPDKFSMFFGGVCDLLDPPEILEDSEIGRKTVVNIGPQLNFRFSGVGGYPFHVGGSFSWKIKGIENHVGEIHFGTVLNTIKSEN